MSRAIQSPAAQVPHTPHTPAQPVVPRERVSREQGGKQGSSSSSSSSSANAESKSSLGTSVGVPVQPNAPREDAGRQGGGQQGGQGGAGQGAQGQAVNGPHDAAASAMAQAVSDLTAGAAEASLLGLGADHVLLNLGKQGRHTFATGSLIPRRYLRQYNKLTLGRHTDPWEEDESTDGGSAPMSAEEYEAIVREMARARINAGRSVLEASSRLPSRQKAKAG
ncbi:MAG: hypothetical protein U1E65_02765 [Myxococcota bacterium]